MFSLSYLVLPIISYVALDLIIAGILRYSQQHKFAKQHGCLPAKNRASGGDPILGISFLLETVRRAKKSQYLECGLDRFRSIGTTYVNERLLYTTVNTIDPENVKEVLATSFNDFEMPTIRIKAMLPLFGNGIFVNDGAKWAHFRGLLRPMFTHQNMTPLLDMTERHFQVFLRRLPTDCTTVDLQPLFYNFTLDTATEYFLGSSTNTLDPEKSTYADVGFAKDYLSCCEEAVRIIQKGPLHHLQMKKNPKTIAARDRAWAYVDRYVDQVLTLRQTGKLDRNSELDRNSDDYNFLSELARDTDNREVLRAQLLNVLLASRDTTAALLGNIFWVLSRYPEAYTKLRAEVQEHVGKDLPTEAHFKDMTWLRWCINESLRLHPIVPVNTRQATRDVALPIGGGPDGKSPLLVKKGTCVLMNLFAMHRREDVFGPDVEEFRPERWDGLRPGYAFLPFHGGPRICIGQQFALTEVSYVIVRMVQSFAAIEAREFQPYTEYYTIALFSKNGVQVGLKPSVEVSA